jgi:hypothetical protein
VINIIMGFRDTGCYIACPHPFSAKILPWW